jgi:hypothetical protein
MHGDLLYKYIGRLVIYQKRITESASEKLIGLRKRLEED